MWSMTHGSMHVLTVTIGTSWIHTLFICWQNWKICNILITLSVTKTFYIYLSLLCKSQFPCDSDDVRCEVFTVVQSLSLSLRAMTLCRLESGYQQSAACTTLEYRDCNNRLYIKHCGSTCTQVLLASIKQWQEL